MGDPIGEEDVCDDALRAAAEEARVAQIALDLSEGVVGAPDLKHAVTLAGG
jgi:hypothetical protein